MSAEMAAQSQGQVVNSVCTSSNLHPAPGTGGKLVPYIGVVNGSTGHGVSEVDVAAILAGIQTSNVARVACRPRDAQQSIPTCP